MFLYVGLSEKHSVLQINKSHSEPMNDSLTEVEVPLLDINKVSIIFFQ